MSEDQGEVEIKWNKLFGG